MVTTQQPPALQLPQSSPPLLDQEHHHHLHLLHLHFLASETAVLISSNSPNYLGLQVSVSSVKTKHKNAENHTHLDDCFLKDPSIKNKQPCTATFHSIN